MRGVAWFADLLPLMTLVSEEEILTAGFVSLSSVATPISFRFYVNA
jgi:hypothetical protein